LSAISVYKPGDTDCIRGQSSSNIMNTSYQSNFGPKIAEHINIKELDACRDKFKYFFFELRNLPIIFGRKEK